MFFFRLRDLLAAFAFAFAKRRPRRRYINAHPLSDYVELFESCSYAHSSEKMSIFFRRNQNYIWFRESSLFRYSDVGWLTS